MRGQSDRDIPFERDVGITWCWLTMLDDGLWLLRFPVHNLAPHLDSSTPGGPAHPSLLKHVIAHVSLPYYPATIDHGEDEVDAEVAGPSTHPLPSMLERDYSR
jgi:hypothetical protein